ncbi:MAG: hypothetical protein AAGH83_09465 [Pseudomonadota bacterium]
MPKGLWGIVLAVVVLAIVIAVVTYNAMAWFAVVRNHWWLIPIQAVVLVVMILFVLSKIGNNDTKSNGDHN